MKTLLLLSMFCFLYIRVDSKDIPRFNREFLTRYKSEDYQDRFCSITAESVSSQMSCLDCMMNVSSILLTNDGSKAYIGTKSMLLSVDLDDCKAISNLPWMGNPGDTMNCNKNGECANYLSQIIRLEENELVACGTNYGNPEALRLNDMTMLERLKLPQLCTQSPSWPTDYIRSENALFVAINEDAHNSRITKFVTTNENLLTSLNAVTTDSKWLDTAEFISTFEHGDFVYFVMRERINGAYAATVGRVCISDPGFVPEGQSKLDKLFTTFTKSRFTCEMSIGRGTTLHFGVITAATFDQETGVIYATFTQYLDVDIGGYVLCSFDLGAIDASFNGKYIMYNAVGAEVNIDLGYVLNCTDYRNSYEAKNMYITSTIIRQLTEYPLYYELKKFTSILSETVKGTTIIYIGTDTGTVEKIIITEKHGIVMASEYTLAGAHIPINTLQFSSQTNRRMLVGSTDTSVLKFSIERCILYELDQCIAIRDPHCCWCRTSHSCSHIDDCSICVNDPETGMTQTAFGRLDTYTWKRRGECEPDCNVVEVTCTRGRRKLQSYHVFPELKEFTKTYENCSYTGKWQMYDPESNNVTVIIDGDNEAMFGMKDSKLYKIIAIVFAALFVASLVVIVVLMVARSRATRPKYETKKKVSIERSNSNNIISAKPISYMMSSKTPESQPMMTHPTHLSIMPQDMDHVTNSPYRSHMTTEDERLLQLREPPQEYQQQNSIFSHTLPRNFGNNGAPIDRNEPTRGAFMTVQRNRDIHSQFNRFPPNMLP